MDDWGRTRVKAAVSDAHTETGAARPFHTTHTVRYMRWLPACRQYLAAVEEVLVSSCALTVLVDAVADGPVALPDVILGAVLGEVTTQPVAVDGDEGRHRAGARGANHLVVEHARHVRAHVAHLQGTRRHRNLVRASGSCLVNAYHGVAAWMRGVAVSTTQGTHGT